VRQYHFGDGRIGTYLMMASDLLETKPIQVGEWQAMDVSKSRLHETHELEDVSLVWERIPRTPVGLHSIMPGIDVDWAWEHFRERVSGIPHNPAPSHVRWPYAVRGNADHTDESTRFDHTYPERFWPQHAGHRHDIVTLMGDDNAIAEMEEFCGGTPGIRFHYGDLRDVVNLLVKSPLTRQAVLPVWFPEDTGAVEGQRVPCTIAYHFMQRGGRLTCRYYIRSCDIYRHLSNDVFFAAALTQWICDEVTDATKGTATPMRFRPGGLVMHISSLHAFVGDVPKIKTRIKELSEAWPIEGVPV
jgi:hypothetical protein